MDIHELRQFESVYKPSKEVAFCWLRKQYVQLSTEENHTEIVDHANDSLRIWQAAKAQAVPEGYILIPKKMPDEVNDHLWDFMTDNFVCTNDYGDSFMACDDFNLDKLYAELVKAQELAND